MHENIQTHVECSNFVGSLKGTCRLDELCIMVANVAVTLSAAVSGSRVAQSGNGERLI